jgi:hypothetical protein
MRFKAASMMCRILVIISPQAYQPRSDIRWGREIFPKKNSYGSIALDYCSNYSPKCLASSVDWVLDKHFFHPVDLFIEGFGLALLKFSEVYQLPLDARFS